VAGSLLFTWVAALLLIEARWPYVRLYGNRWDRWYRNIALGATCLAVSPLLLWGITEATGAIAPLMVVPIVLQWLALDLWTYAMHRAYHRAPWLWRFHAPHHLDEQLDVTSAFRFHLGEIVISGIMRLIPALLLGIRVETLLLFETILLGAAVFHHSNIKLPQRLERWLSLIVVTPSIHWVHHHNVRSDTDSNYSAILSLWDRLFGSKSPTVRMPGMTIGVEALHDVGLLSLLAYPFFR
jgi:sterol desaturase/sphingolipid hydroxylase (fatty acid hydroxylase superfamily)